MRTTLFLLLYVTVALTNAQTIISLNGTPYSEVTMPRRDVEEVDDGIIVTYYFDNAIVQQDPLYPECVLWRIPGFGLNEVAGEPAVPSRWDSFTFPSNTNVVVEVIDSSYIDYSMHLSPARPLLVDSDTIEHTRSNVIPIVAFDGFFPASLIEFSTENVYRGTPLLDVATSSLQYDYNRQILRAYKMIKYKVTFLTSYRRNVSSIGIDDYDPFLSLATINPPIPVNEAPSLEHISNATKVDRDYLIITNSTLYPIAEQFAIWKRTLGFRTTISVNDGWNIQAVKDTVARYYENLNLYYLLILGDEKVVPSPSFSSLGDFVSDLSYVCMDGKTDYVADIYYGRIPVNNILDASIVLEKIRSYEKTPVDDKSFYQRGLHCAYFQDKDTVPNYADRRFAQTSEQILQYVVSQEKTINRVYYTEEDKNPLCWNNGRFGFGDSIPSYLRKPTFPWDGDSSDIIDFINDGCFYVLHRDHGDFNGWGEPKFRNEHVGELSNNNKLPVVFSLNCSTGRYQQDSIKDCFAEALLKKKDGGAVAVYAATGSTTSGYNDALAIGMFDAIWPNPGMHFVFPGDSTVGNITPTPIPTYELGQILAVGMLRMQETWSTTSKSRTSFRKTRRLFHVFGDPSMQIYTDYPTSIQNPEVCRIGDTIFVKVKDGEARIAFYTPSSNQVDTYYGTNVNYQTASDDVIICISRHNNIPYITHSNKLVYIQNEIINNSRDYIGENVKVGRNVTDKKVQGDVIVNDGNVNIAGKRVELQSGTKIRQGAVLKINNL